MGGCSACIAKKNLFAEHQWLLSTAGAKYEDLGKTGLKKGDMIFVIDMQNDFVPAADSGHGRFGVAEGADCVVPIVRLIEKAAQVGARIMASRDYHPEDHCSFNTATPPGPFPPHCIQGHGGSHFLPPIAAALKKAKTAGADVEIVFKGFHPRADSFGALQYTPQHFTERALGHAVGTRYHDMCHMCCAVDWTGSYSLKCSNLIEDINAPPDVIAVLDRKPLQDKLRDIKRLFVVGLAMDFCVCDSALNASDLGIAPGGIYIPVEAARAAYIPGVGQFGSGFLSDPAELVQKLQSKKVKLCHVDTI